MICHSNLVPNDWKSPFPDNDTATRWDAYVNGFIPICQQLIQEGLIDSFGITGIGGKKTKNKIRITKGKPALIGSNNEETNNNEAYAYFKKAKQEEAKKKNANAAVSKKKKLLQLQDQQRKKKLGPRLLNGRPAPQPRGPRLSRPIPTTSSIRSQRQSPPPRAFSSRNNLLAWTYINVLTLFGKVTSNASNIEDT